MILHRNSNTVCVNTSLSLNFAREELSLSTAMAIRFSCFFYMLFVHIIILRTIVKIDYNIEIKNSNEVMIEAGKWTEMSFI